jgi:hypothetical protein
MLLYLTSPSGHYPITPSNLAVLMEKKADRFHGLIVAFKIPNIPSSCVTSGCLGISLSQNKLLQLSSTPPPSNQDPVHERVTMLTSQPLFILSFLFFRAVLAQQFINFTAIDPNQCAAPSAYLSCYEGVVQNTAKCMNETEGNPTAQKGCGCVGGEEKINCFAGACWNRVRSFFSLSLFSRTFEY